MRPNRVAVLPALGLNGPNRPARFLVERHQTSIQLAHVDPTVAYSNASARPAATNGRDGVVEVRLIFPENLAGLDAQRENVVCARDNVDHSLINDGLRFTRIFRLGAGATQVSSPYALQVADRFTIDGFQR